MPTPRCHILELPTELRLQVYDYVLRDSEAITIASAAIAHDCSSNNNNNDSSKNDSNKNDSNNNSGRSGSVSKAIDGLPSNHLPLVTTYYDPDLLSISTPPTLVPHNALADAPAVPTPLSLLLTNRHLNSELGSHLHHPRTHRSSLYITYPYGLLVCQAQCPHLLQQARHIRISGAYTGASSSSSTKAASPTLASRALPGNDSGYFSFSRSPSASPSSSSSSSSSSPSSSSATSSPSSPAPHTTPTASTTALATSALSSLVRTVLSPSPSRAPLFRSLELRIYYPDEGAYYGVWGDDSSPIVVALRSICGGAIDVEVWRGRRGTGVRLVARPNPASRVVSTVWRRLGDGREESEGFVVGEGWGGE